MFRRLHHRAGHQALLLVVAAGLFLPNLGGPSLWDIDEGNNAEAAREMLESGNWVVPTFNFALRVDKPALLYWLQVGAYRAFGVGEFAARLPSALAALVTVLLTYELGRRLFDPATGLLAGLVLASTALFCGSAHFANPDALLNAFTVLTLLCFWHGFARGGRGWFVPAGVGMGLAVLAKGPVGLLLPSAVIGLFLLGQRRLRLLLDRRLLLGAAAFALVALPWYIYVAAETKAQFLRGFLLTHNVGRYLSPMEHHGGPVYYYLLALILGFAPWSAFLALVAWHSWAEWKKTRQGDKETGRYGQADASPQALTLSPCHLVTLSPCHPLAHAFLWCWIAVYFLFFSLAGTKLPNYILPLYPPAALLTARFFERWQRGAVQPAAWAVHVSLATLALVGVGATVGLLVAGGVVPAPFLRGRLLPGLEAWAVLGALPILGAAGAWWCVRRQNRAGVVVSVAAAAVLFIGTLAAGGSVAVDRHKAPRPLVQAFGEPPTAREIRVACYQYFQPSLVFYCRREVERLVDERETLEFLAMPLPVYLFVPAPVWERLQTQVPGPHRLLGRQRDLYRGYDVVVVTNR
jgi:4-amino-4-deoxy-L-arabinose transferase-like glycosyltransferase